MVAINDLFIRQNDLIAATSGRAFWILDDLSPLQQLAVSGQSFQIFQPKDNYRLFGGDSNAPEQGRNPRMGIYFDYYLEEAIDSLEVKLEILQDNKVIRTLSSKRPEGYRSWPGGPPPPQVLPKKQGYNRFSWGFDRDPMPGVDKVFVFGGLNGGSVAPGIYTLRMSYNGKVSETQATVLPNPAVKATASDWAAQQQMLNEIEGVVTEMHESVTKMRSAKSQIARYAEYLADNESAASLIEKGKEISKRITQWEENLIQANQKTFQDVINFNNKLNAQFRVLAGYIDQDDPNLTAGAKQRFKDLMDDWKVYQDERDAIINTEMQAYNALYNTLQLPAIFLDD